MAKNTATMMVSRFLDGFAGSAFLSVAGGTVGDLFPRSELSLPMMVRDAPLSDVLDVLTTLRCIRQVLSLGKFN